MGKLVIDTFTTDQVQTDANTSNILVTATGAISCWQQNGPWAINIITPNAKVTVNGLLVGTDSNVVRALGLAINNQVSNVDITVGKTGYLLGDIGIYSSGIGAEIVNAGRVQGQINEAIHISGDDTVLRNSGVLFGRTGLWSDGANANLVNAAGGEITAAGSGIAVDLNVAAGERDKFTNHGLVVGAILGDAGNDHVVNTGTIRNGHIYLAGGDDTIDVLGANNVVVTIGGTGDDTLITDKAKYILGESVGEGFDTVKSSVSYQLNANVENLTLIGNKNVNATGSNDVNTDNFLYGNVGNNVLKGLGGYNELFGRGGTDTLIGGANYDLFGIGKGYGHDTVKGFQNGLDQIDIYLLGPDRFAELRPHIEEHNADTWLRFGKDVLILKGVDSSQLDASDFLYNY